ncbi:hypothetical protein [Caulobacter segnis]
MFRVLFLIAGLAIASPALAAPCVEGLADAKPLDIADPEIGAPMLIMQGLWTGMLIKSYEADLKTARGACERGAFEAKPGSYDLRGEGNLDKLARVAVPKSKKDPVGYLSTTPDLMTAMKPGFTGPAPVLGYALVTVDGDVHTTWRVYDKVPVDAVLLTDFAQALSGQIQPLMRWKGGKVEIIVPKR